jgi:hypothetical protein
LDIAQANADVCIAAINTALAANDKKQAQLWLQISLRRFAQDPRMLEIAARFEQQRGDPKRAAAYYRAALQLSGPPSIGELTDSSARAAGTNSVEVSPRQQLLDLLSSSPSRSQGSRQGILRDESYQDTQRAPRRIENTFSEPYSNHVSSAFDDEDADAVTHASQGRRVFHDDSATDAPGIESHYARNTAYGARAQATAAIAEGRDNSADRPRPNREAIATAFQNSNFQSSALHEDPAPETRDQAAHPEESRSNKAEFQPAISNRQAVNYASTPDDAAAGALAAALKQASARQRDVPTEDAWVSSSALEPLPTESIQPLPPLVGPQNFVAPSLSPRQQAEQNLENVQSALSPYFGGVSAIGYHSGQPGFDQLTIFNADIEQSSMIGMGARVSVLVQPTLLQNGTALETASFRLGTLPLGAVPSIQTAAGVGGEVQLQTRSFGASLGYTPRGFLVQNVTGRLVIQPGDGPVIFKFEREPNQETQLSYAGLRDPGSATSSYAGNVWGGVIDNAASLEVTRGDAVSGWYVQGGGQYITGQHVYQNYRLDGAAGAYWALWQRPDLGKLTLGTNFFGMHYEDNQRLFTYGNGGYFSPGAYLLSSVPITFDGHYQNRFQYQAKGSLGLQAFEEDSSPYFPLDPSQQNSEKNQFTAERTSVGANYSLNGDASYLITEHWHAGMTASFNNSYDYKNAQVAFYVRYTFHPESIDISGGPTSLGAANQGLRPLLSK